ncbi:hypothetical protein CRI77_08420 [Mycolicibacterium duvalii]|uniref:Membrane protein n=1 Tax=Mycolicibacterium duvalii TaxID=39688 RepID=A0A7I7K357_9MYCO|nr:hypothetical protein [Mycolicibacterium duvalii]MCV7367912.1 hypothetical protein [Mycolicibacterium duvalii]PEG42591.1 hypothetical protein CRI77_08420 [Mycolicibacterium duvalii]BBX18497.1 membrane protein [Mycolicibacterium duvalii]
MQTFTFGVGVWMRRLVARNPLVRATDRVEAMVVVAVAALSILAIPVAGSVGTAEYDRLVHTFADQQLTRQSVDATAVQDSREAPQPYQRRYVTEIRWNFAGVTHTDEVRTNRMSAGDRLPIWVDETGAHAGPAPTAEDAVAGAVSAAMGFWTMVAGAGLAVWAAVRLWLVRARFSAWDRELDDLADNGGRANNAN